MNNLIEINEGNNVIAMELNKFLGLNQSQFSRWAKSNIENNAFAEESVDFQGFDIDVEGNKVTDYAHLPFGAERTFHGGVGQTLMAAPCRLKY